MYAFQVLLTCSPPTLQHNNTRIVSALTHCNVEFECTWASELCNLYLATSQVTVASCFHLDTLHSRCWLWQGQGVSWTTHAGLFLEENSQPLGTWLHFTTAKSWDREKKCFSIAMILVVLNSSMCWWNEKLKQWLRVLARTQSSTYLTNQVYRVLLSHINTCMSTHESKYFPS